MTDTAHPKPWRIVPFLSQDDDPAVDPELADLVNLVDANSKIVCSGIDPSLAARIMLLDEMEEALKAVKARTDRGGEKFVSVEEGLVITVVDKLDAIK